MNDSLKRHPGRTASSEPSGDWLAAARDVLRAEAEAIGALIESLDERFTEAVDLLLSIRGRVIVTGMGKSGLVARKAAATFRSTGTPAYFLHPAEALHGDLGLLTPDDAVLALSKSGRTTELAQLLPLVERLGVPVVAIVGDGNSQLARAARVVLPLPRTREAGPSEVVPTASAAATMALCDALAVALMKRRGFDAESLAFIHAGGLVGRQAVLRVGDIMHSGDHLPVVADTVTLREALLEIIRKKLGMTTVVDAEGRLAGVLTDGDLKRILLSADGEKALGLPVSRFMTLHPRTTGAEASVAAAVRRMEDKDLGFITSLVVVDPSGCPLGVVHLHDCLRPV